jgi:hypothetical protein
VSILANSGGCEDCAGAALVVVWLTNRNASTPGAKLLVWLPVAVCVAEEPEDDCAAEALDDVLALDWVDAKFANRELNSLARSAIEAVVLPLLDWVIVVIGVAEVVGNMLTVMESLLSGDYRREAGQAACQPKKSRDFG